MLLALFVPYFGLVVNLIGACTNTFAGFILPPCYFLKICWDKVSRKERALNVFIIVFGLLGGGIATTVSVQAIAHCIVTNGKGTGC